MDGDGDGEGVDDGDGEGDDDGDGEGDDDGELGDFICLNVVRQTESLSLSAYILQYCLFSEVYGNRGLFLKIYGN